MRQILVDVTRHWLNTFKKIMIEQKERGSKPAALVYPEEGNETLLVLEWTNKEEQAVILGKLPKLVLMARIHTVIIFGTAPIMHVKTHEEVLALFGTIYQQGSRPYTVAYQYAMVNGEPVFSDEINSSELTIAPWLVPDLWPPSENSPKPLLN